MASGNESNSGKSDQATPGKEDLRAINAELKRKLEHLAAARIDLENVLAATDIAAVFLDTELRIRRATPRAMERFGIAESDIGRAIVDFTDGLNYRRFTEDAAGVLQSHVPVEHEVGTDEGRWMIVRLHPYRTRDDEIEGVVITFADVTGQRWSETRLRRSEDRFRALVSATSDVVYRMSPDWSQMRELKSVGFLSDTSESIENWSDKYILPEDQPHVWQVIREAIRKKGVFELEHRVRLADGSVGWTHSRAVPILDEDGAILEWFGAASDLTERRRREEAQRLLVHELNHRVKNMLAIVQSVARQTKRTSPDMDTFSEAFEHRLHALAAAHDVFNRSNWEGVDLGELVRRTLETFVTRNAGRLRIEGQRIQLRPEAVFSFALVLHELSSNALKYGALSVPKGRVEVTWEIDADLLVFQWIERDGPKVAAPKRKGFGSRLLERGVTRELDGAVQVDFRAEGLSCRLELPRDASIRPD